MSGFGPLDWFPGECYWSGLEEAPFATREYYRAAISRFSIRSTTVEGR